MQFDFRESINKADGRGDGLEASDRKYQTGVSLLGKKQKNQEIKVLVVEMIMINLKYK